MTELRTGEVEREVFGSNIRRDADLLKLFVVFLRSSEKIPGEYFDYPLPFPSKSFPIYHSSH
jgi:hypothetical protein